MKILGIDPGLGSTGYGMIEVQKNHLTYISCGSVNKSTKAEFAENLLLIYEKIEQIIREYHPDSCAIENVFYHQNKKTAIVMGHARGVAMLAAAKNELPIYEYSPREIKMSIVGSGAASKIQVQAMVKNLLSMREIPHPDDAADALAVAICHVHRTKTF